MLEFSWNNASGFPNVQVEIEDETIKSVFMYVEPLDSWEDYTERVIANTRLTNKIYASYDQYTIVGD